MKVLPYTEIEAKEADEGAEKLTVRWLITKEMGAPNFAMRLFEMEPDGHSPLHSHPWEHEVFVLEGEGTLVGADSQKRFKTGDAIYVAPSEKHQFKNTGKKRLRFICMVPHRSQ